MDKSNTKKYRQLGQPHGTAAARLRKLLLFQLIIDTKQDVCFRCQKPIVDIDDLSIEHKEPWLDSDNPRKMFFDLKNIAFSHLSCNVGAKRQTNKKYFTDEEIHTAQVQGQRNWRKNNKEKYSLVRRDKYQRLGT